MVSIPLPQINIPRFRFGSKRQGGVGQGEGDVGDASGKGDPQADGPGKAGDQAGRARARGRAVAGGAGRRSWARSCSCRASSPRASSGSSRRRTSTSASAAPAPSRCATSSAPSGRRCGGRSRRAPTTRRTRSSCRCARTSATDRGGRDPLPQSNAVIIYMMDVSGSMGDEQKEIVRIEILLDRHLAALAVQGHRERATSSTTRWPRRSTATPSSARASRAAR